MMRGRTAYLANGESSSTVWQGRMSALMTWRSPRECQVLVGITDLYYIWTAHSALFVKPTAEILDHVTTSHRCVKVYKTNWFSASLAKKTPVLASVTSYLIGPYHRIF